MTYECLKKGSNDSITRQVTIYKSQIRENIEVTPSIISGSDLKAPVTRFVQKQSDGIYMIAIQIGDMPPLKVDNKIPLLKTPIKEGTFLDSDVGFLLSDVSSPVISHHTYSLDDTNTAITVPYGQFTNCIRMKYTIRGAETVNEVTFWLAPKIGLVKSIEIMKSNKTNNITETEMSLKNIDYNTPTGAAQVPMGIEKKERATIEWLTDNYIANMKGVDFLLLYITIIIAALILGWKFIRNADSTGQEPPLPLPSNPDPYELAYLRGGVQEVIRLAVFKLVQVHSLVSNAKDFKIVRASDSAEPPAMSDMERIVYKELDSPQTMRSVCRRLSSEFKERCFPLEQRLYNDRLLTTQAALDRARMVMIALLSIIFLLGGYKLAVALSRGRTNVIFLVVSAVIGAILTIRISRTRRLSRRGSDYLKRLQAELKDEKNAAVPEVGIEGPNLTLLVALFGFGVLQGTAYAQYVNVLAPSRSSFNDNYVSSGGCGGGGGCGGCGGGN